MARATRVALALGSGGARGYAHIGAIEVLEERGFEIVAVAGSSMGALVGGVHAAGKRQEYAEWARTLNQIDVVRLLDLKLGGAGAIQAEKVFSRLHELLGDTRIEDLPIPYTAVAADLFARREVWFQRGPLERAIRASIAIPSVITPVVLNGRVLADGGLLDPVPIAPMASVTADATIAVSLGGEPTTSQRQAGPATETAEERPVEEWVHRVRRGASRLLANPPMQALRQHFGGGAPEPAVEVDATEPDEDFGELPAGLTKWDVMGISIDILQSVLARYRLAGYPPDVLVSVPKDACRSLDFHRAAELIEVGRTLTIEALDRAALAPTQT